MKKLLNALKYLLLLTVGILLFWLAYNKQDFGVILREAKNIHIQYILVAFIIATLSHWGRAVRWNLLINPLGYKVSTTNSFFAVMIGYLANLALPRMGEISRCVVLNRTDKIPVDRLIGTVIIERLIDMITLLIITFLALILEFNRLKAFFSNSIEGMFGKKSEKLNELLNIYHILMYVSILAILIIAVIVIYRKYKDHTLVRKLHKMLDGFVSGIGSIKSMEKRGLFIFYSFFIWFMYYLMVYLSFKALDATHDLGVVAALTVLVTGSYGFVAPVQGGIGAYHAAVSQTLLLYGLTIAQGLTFAFVAHTFQMSVVLILGGLSFIGLGIVNRRQKKIANESADTVEAV